MELHALDLQRIDALAELTDLVNEVIEELRSDVDYVLESMDTLFPSKGTSSSAYERAE